MVLDDPSAQCKPDPGSRYISSMESLKRSKDQIRLLGLKSFAIIFEREGPDMVLETGGNVYSWLYVSPAVLNGVAEEILHKLGQLVRVSL